MEGKKASQALTGDVVLKEKKNLLALVEDELKKEKNSTRQAEKRKEIEMKMNEYGAEVSKSIEKQAEAIRGSIQKSGKSRSSSRADLKSLARLALEGAPTTTDKNGKKIFTKVESGAKNLIDLDTLVKLSIPENKVYTMGSVYSPRKDKSEATSNPADLSSLGAGEDVYVPLKDGEFVCFVFGTKKYLIEQKTEAEIEITIDSEPPQGLPVGECLDAGKKRICSGSVVTAEKEGAVEASSGSTMLESALSIVVAAALAAMLL